MKPRRGSAGKELRDALARNNAHLEGQEQREALLEQQAFARSLSNWFNSVAADVPVKIDAITRALKGGQPQSPDFSYSAADNGVNLRGIESIDLTTLEGFKQLDVACRELDVECTVTKGRYGYGRKSTAGQPYLHVNVDAEKPYQPLQAETAKPRRHGGRFR
ncbi:MAG: hypothetical protein ACAH80_15020 [Alphaproteobacteria bacterium]